uniref:C-type lectin domain-containing protein n=1 Tax=Strigamia maritima TaxID=126957 RepID=T1J2K3_STRMM
MGNFYSNSESNEAMKTSTQDVVYRATSMAYESSGCACCIAINNSTEFSLQNPSFYCSTGTLQAMPKRIESEYTAIILAESRLFYSEGTCGVISYEIKFADGRDKKLQIVWYVPPYFKHFVCGSSINIRIGSEIANEDLFDKMYKCNTKDAGYWCNAVATPHHIFNLDQFEAEVFMTNKAKTPLIIDLRKRLFISCLVEMRNVVNWLYPDTKYDADNDTETETGTTATSKTGSRRKGRHVIAWIIVCMVMIILFGSGLLFGYFIRLFETVDCATEPSAKRHQNRSSWNGSHLAVCKENPPLAMSPYHHRNWQSSELSRQIGTVITYHCTLNQHSFVYRMVMCDKKLEWRVIMNEWNPLICKNKYHIETKLMNYDEAKESCLKKGGELAIARTLDEESRIRKVIDRGGAKCQKVFLAAKEDVSDMWRWLSKEKLDLNKTHWTYDYPKGVHRCVILVRSTMKWVNEDCTNPHCFICEEDYGSCFGHGKCLAVSYQMSFKYAEIACSNMAHSLVTNFPNKMSETRKLRSAINTIDPSVCSTFYIGLRLKYRIYSSDTDEKNASVLQSGCITLDKSHNYRHLHGVPCESKACSICLFQGPDRPGFKNV